MNETVTAEEVARAFEADPSEANLRWGGASLQVRGSVVFAGESHSGDPLIVLEGRPGGPLRVALHVRPQQREKVVALQPGAIVEALGTLEPFRFGTLVALGDAVLAPPGAAAVAAEFQQLAAWARAVSLDGTLLFAGEAEAPASRSRQAKKKRPAPKKKKAPSIESRKKAAASEPKKKAAPAKSKKKAPPSKSKKKPKGRPGR